MRLMTGIDDARKPASQSSAGLLTRPLRPYAEIFEIPGAWRFSTAAIIGRMPMSMFGLGTVLLISAVTGKYGVAGSVGAGFGRWARVYLQVEHGVDARHPGLHGTLSGAPAVAS